ncbi:MAG: polysaccharide biosynthesis protein [Bacteroidales bacterium]|nr:polysaccharide biosynthesis protein [Bacteroidales bacterium]
MKILNWFFSKSTLPYWCVIILDSLIIAGCWCVVYWFNARTSAFIHNFPELVLTILMFLVVHGVFFRVFHTYSGILRFSSFVDLQRVGFAMMCAAAIIIGMHYFTNKLVTLHGYPFVVVRSLHIVIATGLATVLMWMMRVTVKYLYDAYFMTDDAENAMIFGIQAGGISIAKSIRTEKPVRFRLKGFISHDSSLTYSRLMGEKIYPADAHLTSVLQELNVKAILVSPLRTEQFRADTVLQDYIIASGAKIYMMPPTYEWEKGMPQDLKPVKIEDLLPREQINVNMSEIARQLKGRRVLITGAAGSIGSEIVRQVAKFEPAAMMLIDQAETPEHDLRLMMAKDYPGVEAKTVVCSICQQLRMENIFSSFKPEYVFHAAAYKHVPMMEDNPSEAIFNNVYGTKVLADLSVKYGVIKFVMISTDKAVNPTNVMGCSKRICEIYVQSLNKALQSGEVKGSTQFVTTRFGNVLGSNGSVIPLFEAQIKAGGPVTVTDPNIIRYFMLIPEACKLVLEAGAMGKGGEIFVFDMGAPVRIADLAKRMIRLSGAEGVEIKYTGLRDGEKLYEEVLSEKESTKPTFHEKIRIAQVREYEFKLVCKRVDELVEVSKKYDPMATVTLMKKMVPEFVSNNSVYSVLDK